jgi:type II secretory pathway pseudopilin PulG
LRKREQKCAGWSLFELLLVVALIGIVAALVLSQAARTRPSAGGAERVMRELRQRLEERRAAAIRLQPLVASTSLEGYTLPNVDIDFMSAATTAPLLVESTTASNGSWNFVYTADALVLPQGWQVAQQPGDLGSWIPLLGNGANGRGVLVTHVAFDGNGFPQAQVSSVWQPVPAGAQGTNPSSTPDSSNAPFWAVYAVSGDRKAAIAVAIHPGGVFEEWRWTGSTWQGFQLRTLN